MTVVLDSNGELVSEPKINTIGLIDPDDMAEEQFIGNLHEEIVDILEDMGEDEISDDHFVTEELRIGVRRFVFNFLGIKPAANIHVVRIP